MELVSIIMSTYNEPVKYVQKALDSIRQQSYQYLQIIVVLDNPQNIELGNFVRNSAKIDSRIVVVENTVNRGLVYSLNKALSVAKGVYVARMDADDISVKKRIETQIKYLQKNKLDLVGSLITDIDENDNNLHDVTPFPETSERVAKYLKYGSPIPHPTWFGKKTVFDKLQGYQDIDACEDYDFLCRAALSGIRLGVVQKPLLFYRINSNGISSTKKCTQKTALYFIRKHYRKGQTISAESFKRFMESKPGKDKKAALNQYYQMSSELKKKSGLHYYIYGAYMYVRSNEARNAITTICACKRLSMNSRRVR